MKTIKILLILGFMVFEVRNACGSTFRSFGLEFENCALPLFAPEEESFQIYPNTTDDYLNIVFESLIQKPIQISLYNDQQKKVLHSTLKDTNVITLDVRSLPRGQYFLHIYDGKN